MPDAFMADPPFSHADLRRAYDDLVATGKRWREAPDDFLVGVCGRHESADAHVIDGARVELLRRSVEAQRGLQGTMIASTEIQKQLVTAIQVSGDCASAQTAEVIKLTNTLKLLTVVLVGVGIVQIVLAAVQLWANH